ncbi:CAP domain-containing protein [Rhodococcus sp. NPDC003348]
MSASFKHALLPLSIVGVSLLAATTGTAPAHADHDLPYGPDTCVQGYVWREARVGDTVCVPPQVRSRTAQENATAADRVQPGGGAYGPNTCKQGFVWREAFNGDVVCVTPDIRSQTWADNAAADSRYQRNQPNRHPQQQPGGDQGGAVLNLINQQRAANGCGPVASNGQLAAAASRHATDMLNSGVTGHTGSDGSSPDARIAAAGYAPVARWGEIVYWGTGGGATPEAAVNWWMNSPGHRAIITNCALTDAGVSTSSGNGKMTAVGDFATH